MRSLRSTILPLCGALGLALVVALSAAPRAVPTYGAVDGGASVLLSNLGGDSAYTGVGRLDASARCTGVLLDSVGGDGPYTAPAYVLTAGHCAYATGPDDVLVGSTRNATLTLDYFVDIRTRRSYRSRLVAWATMKGQDLAVIELDARLPDLVRLGYTPWRPAFELPRPDELVVVVGTPTQPDPSRAFLRLSACRLGGTAEVVLERQWHWFDLFHSDCQDIAPGGSGAPVISRASGRLLGIVNTTTIGSERIVDCYLNRPCEADAHGAAVRARASYVVPVVGIDRCFGSDGRFDVERPGCPLDRGVQFQARPAWLGSVNPALAEGGPVQPRTRWDVSPGSRFAYYRFKIGPAGSIDCRDLRGYSSTRRVVDVPTIADPLPQEEGHYFLCLVGGERRTFDETWQDLEHATAVAVKIDTTPPAVPPILTVRDEGGSYRVSWSFAPPEISLYEIKSGRPAETLCSDRRGYTVPRTGFAVLPKASAPYTFCAIGYDDAGNPGTPAQLILP